MSERIKPTISGSAETMLRAFMPEPNIPKVSIINSMMQRR